MSTTINYKGVDIASFSNDTKTLTTQGKYLEADVIVTDTSSAPSLQNKTVTPLTTSQSVTADSGYDGLDTVTVNAMPSGSATTPATSITANPSISVSSGGLITATASASKSITPTVSAGYVSSGTAGTVTVSGSNTSQLATQAATTYTPTTTDQTITSGKYLTGAQTIKGDANLIAENIKKDVSIFGVTGTHEGGGGAPTIVSGTFTTQSSGTQTVSIPYTGGGYPVMAFVVTAGGLNKNDPFASSTAYKTIGEWTLIKKYPDLEPNWSTSLMAFADVENQCITHEIMKRGSSVYQMYSLFQDPNTNAAMTSLAPSGNNTGRCAKFISPTSLAIKIFTSSSAYGFMAGQEYQYWVMYSE